ncbi:MAG: SRPBCC domain-containing protein [Aureispira sp.]|nr:SRPBCC domain-containing protein [Aureispira sp.]
MAFSIETSIQIDATVDQVWKVLTAFEEYPTWNPFILGIEGEVVEGNQIVAKIDGMTFKPIVLKYTSSKELRWLGKLWFKGLFDGEHQFLLKSNEDGSTTMYHCEQFKGILVPFFKKMLQTKTKLGFEKMNLSLKQRVEEALVLK